MNNQNKIIISISSLAFLVFFSFFIYIVFSDNNSLTSSEYEKTGRVDEVIDQDSSYLNNISSKGVCNYENYEEAYFDAVENVGVSACECIDDIDMKKYCTESVYDYLSFGEAQRQLDATVCEEIYDYAYRMDCIETVNKDVAKNISESPEQIAFVYFLEHNVDKAIFEYEKLIESDGDLINIDYHLNLAAMYAEKALSLQELGEDNSLYLKKATIVLKRAEEYDGYNSEVYRIKAYVKEVEGQLLDALKIYDEALKLDPENVLAYAGRGHVHDLAGMRQKAIDDFLIADFIDKEHSNAFVQLNICRLLSGTQDDELLEKAITSCDRVVNSKGYDKLIKSEAGVVLGYIYMNNNLYDMSEQALLASQRMYPDNVNMYIAFSNLLIKKGNFDEAIDFANKSIKAAPTKSAGYVPYSQALFFKEKYDSAIESAGYGISLVDNDVSLLFSDKSQVKNKLLDVIADCYTAMGDM